MNGMTIMTQFVVKMGTDLGYIQELETRLNGVIDHISHLEQVKKKLEILILSEKNLACANECWEIFVQKQRQKKSK